MKLQTLVCGEGEVSEMRILNKIVSHTDQGIELEADPRHAELVVREMGLARSKGRAAEER